MLKWQITVRNFDLTPEIYRYIEKRLAKLDRYSRHINKSSVILEEQRGQFYGEILLDVNRKHLKAEYTSSDILEMVDRLKGKIERQLKKYEGIMKGRKSGKKRT